MIITKLFNRDKFSTADIRKVLSIPNLYSTQGTKDINIDGKLNLQVNTSFTYVSTHNRTHFHSLVYWSTNGWVVGKDVTVINTSPHSDVNNWVIYNHDIVSVPIYTVGALDNSQACPFIIIIYQDEYHRKWKTINCYMQIEWYKNAMNHKSRKVNAGEKQILTQEGHIFSLHISQGFSYLTMFPYY